jgi:hypothetical protein
MLQVLLVRSICRRCATVRDIHLALHRIGSHRFQPLITFLMLWNFSCISMTCGSRMQSSCRGCMASHKAPLLEDDIKIMMLRQQPTVQGSQAIPAYQKPQVTHVWYYSRSFAAYPCNFWTSWKADASQRNLKGLCIWPKNNATTVTTASMEPSPYRLWDGNVSLSRNDKLAGPYLILARTAAEERAIHASARRRTDRLEDRVSEP